MLVPVRACKLPKQLPCQAFLHAKLTPRTVGQGKCRCSRCFAVTPSGGLVTWSQADCPGAHGVDARSPHSPHSLRLLGETLWCSTCGCYGVAVYRQLMKPCHLKPSSPHGARSLAAFFAGNLPGKVNLSLSELEVF